MAIDVRELRKRSVLGQSSPNQSSTINKPKASTIPRVDDSAPQFTTSSKPDTSLDLGDIEILRSLYDPESENIKRFTDLIANKPERGKPSLARTIVASGIGLKGGVKGAEEVLGAPHAKAMSDWQSSIEPAQQAANLERQSNANERQLLGSMVNASRDQQRLKESARQADDKIKIQQDRLRLDQWKAEGYKFNFDGAYVMRYKQDGTLENTGIRTENLSQADILHLRSELDLNRSLIMADQNRITQQMPTPDENLSENQMITRRQTKLRSLVESQDPRIAALAEKWIDERNGQYVLKEKPQVTGTWFSDSQEDVDEYNELLQMINPSLRGTPSSAGTATTRTTSSRGNTGGMAVPQNGLKLAPEVEKQRSENQAKRQEAIAWLQSQPELEVTERNIQIYLDKTKAK